MEEVRRKPQRKWETEEHPGILHLDGMHLWIQINFVFGFYARVHYVRLQVTNYLYAQMHIVHMKATEAFLSFSFFFQVYIQIKDVTVDLTS